MASDEKKKVDSIFDAVHPALCEMQRKFNFGRDIPPDFIAVVNHINTFEKEMRYLKLFLVLAHRWTGAEKFVPDLGSLVTKIQVRVKEIGSQFLKKFKTTKNPFSKIFGMNNDLKVLSIKWFDVLSSSIEAIESLKPELRQVYINPLVSNSLHNSQLCSDLPDFGNWKNFAQSVKSFVKFTGFNAYSEIEIGGFVNLVEMIIGFLDDLNMNGTQNPSMEVVMLRVEGIMIQAGFVFLQLWLIQMDQDMVKEMGNVILDLGRQIDLSCSVEFVDMIIEIIKRETVPVRIFVEFFMAVRVHRWISHYAPIYDACWKEMVSLITYLTDTPTTLDRFMGDMKILVMEGGSFRNAFCGDLDPCKDMLLKLLAKVRLLQMEIFLDRQLKLENRNKLSLDMGFHLQNALSDWKNSQNHVSEITKEDDLERVMSIMKTVESDIVYINQSSTPQGITMKMVKVVIFKLLLRTLLLKAELFLYIFKKYDNVIGEEIKSLLDGLKFLSMFIIDQEEAYYVKRGVQLFSHIKTFSRGVISFCHSFPNGKVPEEMFQKTSLWVHTLQDKLKVIMIYLKNICLLIPWSDFPKACPQDFVVKLLRNLKESLDIKSHLSAQVKHEIKEILGHMESLKSLITGIQQQDMNVEEFKGLDARVVKIAYNVECFIDTIVLGYSPELHILLWSYHLLQDITHLKAELEEIYNNQNLVPRVRSISDAHNQDILPRHAPRTEEAVDNGEDNLIIDRLKGGSSHQGIISIIGMPGIGKTTLATKVYNSVSIQYYFHVRAWCYVSQNYRKTQLLLDILSQVNVRTENLIGMSDEDLELKLYQCLKQRRYLIIMDDMWSSRAWEDLKRSLPNDHNGSRILITSRLLDLVLTIKPDSDPHLMALLSDDESWDLLQKKVFHEAESPAELVESGKLIASKCKGLPLSVVAIGGLLERTGKSRDFWNKIAENLSSHVVNDPQAQCMDILSLSYNHLPYNLKVCFLYFSAFPGDKDIPVWKLICLWIAEGFIPGTETKSLEEVAEDYLMNLINWSLVTIAKPRSKGGVQSCRMHDLLQDLCRTKSAEVKFINSVIGFKNPYGDPDEWEYGLDFGYNILTNVSTKTRRYYKDYRLSISSKRRHFVMSEPYGPYIRSLLFFAMSDSYPRCPYDISFISKHLKLLKVLDIESLNMGSSFPTGIESLIHLRYLALSGDIDSLPSSLADLCKLETLLVKGLKGRVVLPDTIWCMSRLRHLHVQDLAIFNVDDDKVSQLDNLVTLSFVLIPQGEDSEVILRGLPSLRKLSCVFVEPRNTYDFPKLDLLTQLESLKIRYYGKAVNTCVFNFPLNLKKLSLSNFCLPWSNISVIGRLPNLEVLKLASRAFEGQQWEMIEGEFLKLKYLKMDSLNIVQWNASEDHFPSLEQLVLQRCTDLEGVPSSFAYIPTILSIEAKWCGSMVEESLKNMQEEEIEGLKIIINTKM